MGKKVAGTDLIGARSECEVLKVKAHFTAFGLADRFHRSSDRNVFHAIMVL